MIEYPAMSDVCMRADVYACVCVCMCVQVCMCATSVCMCVCACVCKCVHWLLPCPTAGSNKNNAIDDPSSHTQTHSFVQTLMYET